MGCVYSRGCVGEICTPKSPQILKPQTRPNHNSPSNSSSSPGSETPDRSNSLSTRNATDQTLTSLSRVSSHNLRPEGSRTFHLPSSNFQLNYSFLSQRGYYPDALDKLNQDSCVIHAPFGSNPEDCFFGVFDGHGEFGAQCSQFVKKKLCENLLRSPRFHLDPAEALHYAYLSTNSQLHADSLDDSMSGTTAVVVLLRGRTIYVANSGDSRAVIGERRGDGKGEIVAVDVSVDQTPFREDELERVKVCGARVLTLDQIEGLKDPEVKCWGSEEWEDDGDPPRLWVPNGMYPGTAFTRSIGDSIAESIGVVANPEIGVLELTERNPFFVVASDGVFEFLTSQTVVDMVAKYKDPRDACAAIVAESYRRWLQCETRTDDITVIVVHINGLTASAVGQSTNQGALLHPSVPQVVEVTGSESPATFSWSSRNQRIRHDLSRTRLRATESSLEHGKVWLPSSTAHRKTWEEEAHIERALHDHFLFRKLTDSQCHVLLDCMQRVEVQPGEVVVQQGGEGDCFYVVGNGEFEVLATQEGKEGEVPRVLQRYTADKLSSFGELALMHNKPFQASVRAVTSGTLWALKREDFRGILMSEFTNLSSLRLLRSVDLLSRLTILQLSHIADLLSEVTFSDGQMMLEENGRLSALYIIQKGKVRITFDMELLSTDFVGSLKSDYQKDESTLKSDTMCSVEKVEGSYFGEWVLLDEHIGSLTAMAVGDCICSVLTKETFDLVVGPLAKLPQYVEKFRGSPSHFAERTDLSAPLKVSLSDLEWRSCLYATDCSEIGLVAMKDSENLLSLKRFTKKKIKSLGREAQVLKEKNLWKIISPSACVPQVVCTCADRTHAGILLNVCLACPLASILHTALDETSIKFCAANIVIALEELHKNGVLYRGISPNVLMLDQMGRIQLVDFRFGKKMSSERTYTICGMADSLAPEIVQGKGHGFPADWWALGVLIYFMLHGEMPFGSWGESDLDTYAKIAKGQLALPQTSSSEAVDLITKLLEVDENARLGSLGSESVKSHPWFDGVDWNGIYDGSVPVPQEITTRIAQQLESCLEDCTVPCTSPTRDFEDLNVPEWLDDW